MCIPGTVYSKAQFKAIMGRGRIRARFKDNIAPGGARPVKAASFSASSIPNANPAVFRELKAGVSKVESRIGIDLPQGNLGFEENSERLGVHFGSGDDRTVLLQKAFFNRNSSEIIKDLRREFKRKWAVTSPTPLQYVIVHELGHSIWVDRVEGRAKELFKLNKGILALHQKFLRDTARGRTPISIYARYNINEFFAETFTKAIIGRKQNAYSRELLKLLREHKDLLKKIR